MQFGCVIYTHYAGNLEKKNFTKSQSVWKLFLGSQKANHMIEHHTSTEPSAHNC